MKATLAAKDISLRTPELVWPEVLPQRLYDLSVPKLPTGRPIELGEDFHGNLEKHLGGSWISKEHYYACSAVGEILDDLNIQRKSLRTEQVLKSDAISGRADIVGKDRFGRDCVVEIKTTLGNFALAPQSCEFAQMAIYADLLGFEIPRLICIRVNLRLGKAAVFYADFRTSEIRCMLNAA